MKSPALGTVKTRLATDVGTEAALDAYLELLANTVQALRTFSEVEVRFTPDDAASEVRRWVSPGWSLKAQGQGDLGQRLEVAFAEAFAAGAISVAAVGSDCPYMMAEDLVTTERLLVDHDLVIGPATDGGYWLIAMNQNVPALFHGIDWSTDRVRTQTRAIADELGLRTAMLRSLSDVDTQADWEAWKVARSAPFPRRLEPKTSEL